MPDGLSAAELAQLDRVPSLSTTGNSQIHFLWLEAALENRYEPAIPQAETFLSTVSRNTFVEPLFEALANEDGQESATPAASTPRRRRPTTPTPAARSIRCSEWRGKGG